MTRIAYAWTAKNTAIIFRVTGIEQVMTSLRGRGVVFEEYDLRLQHGWTGCWQWARTRRHGSGMATGTASS
ncbi:MAG TPA: hypothetical protein VFV13_14645 [Acidimicrobiia bacterium]|nr:hypothetical protein [Acidimicrobiia bacterium]